MSFLSGRTALAHGLVLLALIDCSNATGPAAPDATHPAGTLSTKINGLTGRPFGVRVSSAGVVYTTQQDANSVASFSLAQSTPGASIGVGADPGDVVFNRSGATAFVSAFYGGSVHVIDVASSRQTVAIPIASNAYRLALSADEATLFVSSIRVSGSPRRVAFNTTGSVAVVANESNWVDVVR